MAARQEQNEIGEFGDFALSRLTSIDPLNPKHGTDFTVGKEVGRGAYGTVYQCTEKKTAQVYVMKVIHFNTANDGVPQSVLREISALMSIKKLKHPNIVQLHDAFVAHEDGRATLSILYEKCDWDLHFFLREIPSPMGEEQVRDFSYQLFSGLAFLHSHNIIHRDIKPENILINRNHMLKIADFGLARSFSLHATYTTTVVTLWYRSPELLLQCDYNSSVDIWSAGCIIFELFTRAHLFPGTNESETLFMIMEKMGTPDPADYPADAVVELNSFKKSPRRSVLNYADQLIGKPHIVQLLDSILAFNPTSRPTAYQIINSVWFADTDFSFP